MSRTKLAASLFAIVAIFQMQPGFAQSDSEKQLDAYDNRLSAEETQLHRIRAPTVDQVRRMFQLGFGENAQGNFYAAHRMLTKGIVALNGMQIGDSDIAELATYYNGVAVFSWCTNNWNDCSSYNRLFRQVNLADALQNPGEVSASFLERLQVQAKFSDADLVYSAWADLRTAWTHRTQIASVQVSALQGDCISAEQLYLKVRPSDDRAREIIEGKDPPSASTCQ